MEEEELIIVDDDLYDRFILECKLIKLKIKQGKPIEDCFKWEDYEEAHDIILKNIPSNICTQRNIGVQPYIFSFNDKLFVEMIGDLVSRLDVIE